MSVTHFIMIVEGLMLTHLPALPAAARWRSPLSFWSPTTWWTTWRGNHPGLPELVERGADERRLAISMTVVYRGLLGGDDLVLGPAGARAAPRPAGRRTRRLRTRMTDYREWRTILKLDPARPLSDERLAEVCSWPVDAVIVGGSGGYGLGEVARAAQPAAAVPAARWPWRSRTSGALCPGFDLYFVPLVLNSREVEWVVGHQQAALKRFGRFMDWQRVFGEGYCILNPEATAARMANARTDLDAGDVVAFARLAQDLLRLPIFYLEYSGTYGSPERGRGRARGARQHPALVRGRHPHARAGRGDGGWRTPSSSVTRSTRVLPFG